MWRFLCIAFALAVAIVSATIVTKGMASAVESFGTLHVSELKR